MHKKTPIVINRKRWVDFDAPEKILVESLSWLKAWNGHE